MTMMDFLKNSVAALDDSKGVDLAIFDNDDLIANSEPAELEKLALAAVNGVQLNKVAHAKNMTYKVVTAIMINPKVSVDDLDGQSLLNLAKLSRSNKELDRIVESTNVRVVTE